MKTKINLCYHFSIKKEVYQSFSEQYQNILTLFGISMDKPDEYIGTLEMKAEARGGILRLFLRLVDGRKIITPVFWWQRYLGFYEMDVYKKI